jgi:hypothetical protein
MKFEKIYSIKKGEWTKWSDTLAEAIRDFLSVYTFYPNFIEASEHTLSQFDFLTTVRQDERQRVVIEDDVTGITRLPDKTEEIALGSFSFRDQDIDFVVDCQLADKKFRLVYDDDPDYDEPEIPIDCPENEYDLILV